MASTSEPQVDLGALDFWGRPAEERDRYFAWLRDERPLSQHEPPEDILGLPDQGRQPYWAVVRYEDVRAISRDPKTFCSGEGTQFGDAPPEFLEDVAVPAETTPQATSRMAIQRRAPNR